MKAHVYPQEHSSSEYKFDEKKIYSLIETKLDQSY